MELCRAQALWDYGLLPVCFSLPQRAGLPNKVSLRHGHAPGGQPQAQPFTALQRVGSLVCPSAPIMVPSVEPTPWALLFMATVKPSAPAMCRAPLQLLRAHASLPPGQGHLTWLTDEETEALRGSGTFFRLHV